MEKHIEYILDNITENDENNLKLILNYFGHIKYQSPFEESLLHLFVNNLPDNFEHDKVYKIIELLLSKGLSPNLTDCFGCTFIMEAIYMEIFSDDFIISITKLAINYGLDVNHIDGEGQNYIDYVNKYYNLCSDEYDTFVNLLKSNGLKEKNINQESINDSNNEDLQVQNNENNEDLQVQNNENKVNNEVKTNKSNCNINLIINNQLKSNLEKYGKILNLKKYNTAPTIGREKELENLMISLALDKKRPIIVGESGVGKTAIVDELAYRVINNNVPKFLKNKIILEVSPTDLVAGCQYRGQFEEKISELMSLCEKEDIILFIDEIHTIYGVGSSANNDNDMAGMLKYYVDRSNIKVIGTTTQKEYDMYFKDDALKRRFEKINVLEPDNDILYKIINKVIDDYSNRNNIYLDNEDIKEQLINILISSTNSKSRVYNDKLNNPDLVISLIDKAFAIAKVYDCEVINASHFIDSFKYCDRIYEGSKENAIKLLNNIDYTQKNNITKIRKIDFNNKK